MELTVTSREVKNKSSVKKMRREGGIPAILYSGGKQGKEIVVDQGAFQKLLRSIPKGTLSSKVIGLHYEGKCIPTIVKGIQYQVTTYNVIHLDFQELHEGEEVNLKVPLVCAGVVDCVGVKLGGVLRQVVYAIPVRVKFSKDKKAIPQQFEVDVRDMALGQSKRLKDVSIGQGVRVRMGAEEVVAVIAKR